MIIPISYPLTTKTPLYPNTPLPVIHALRSQEKGDIVNSNEITFSTHSGTHIDAPMHFCNKGKTVADCLIPDTTFFPAYCIDVCKPKSEEIQVHDIKDAISRVTDAEAILLRTGWGAVRLTDPHRYSHDHPWISPQIPYFLEENCPHLRLFGIDQISISSALHREAGHECHRRFLCGERPTLILEDLNLSDTRINGSFSIHIYPFMIAELDAIPVIGVVEKV